jgi:hypothetical protein
MSILEKERSLLEALIADEAVANSQLTDIQRHLCTGRFLTMHKRRRKKLQTRSLLVDNAILDDVLHGQVQIMLDRVGNWGFNAFTLETVTGGESLFFHLFFMYGISKGFPKGKPVFYVLFLPSKQKANMVSLIIIISFL